MKTSEICVIHLSDLHFEKGKYSSVYDDLLDDIQLQIKNDEYVILVVTGDFATKGKVTEAKDEIVEFFRRFSDMIRSDQKLLDVELVPGNHDVDRPRIENKYHKGTYLPQKDAYEDLHSCIYDVFNAHGIKGRKTIGVTCVPYKGKHIAFVRLDTSAFSTLKEWEDEIKDDFAESNAKVAEKNETNFKDVVAKRADAFRDNAFKQRREINEAFKVEKKRIGNVSPYLTFALCHHPLTLLNSTGFDELADILFKKGLYFVDAIICGHKHKAQLSYTLDNSQQRIMLMSGVGWQETQETVMRYSIYRLSLERNICQVSVRMAKEGRKFSEDSSLGDSSNKVFSRTRQYMLPLKANSVGSIISLTARQNEMAKGLYVDQETLSLIPEISKTLRFVDKTLGEYIQKARIDFVLRYDKTLRHKNCDERVLFNDGTLNKSVKKAIIKGRLIIPYIEKVCRVLAESLHDVGGGSEAEYSDGSTSRTPLPEWRVHYRVYKGLGRTFRMKNDRYCAKTAFGFCEGEIKNIGLPSEVSWDGLIRGAFECPSHMLINSAVPGLNPKKETSWSDFMTICPHFKGATIRLDGLGNGVSCSRPLVSFGISYKTDDFDSLQHAARILYLLEYLDVNKVIEAALQNFITAFGLDVRALVKMFEPPNCIAWFIGRMHS